MMLSLENLFSATRFIHFLAVMCLFGGSVFYCFLSEPENYVAIRKIFRFYIIISAILALLSAVGIWCIETGLMGNGWLDIIHPSIWLAMLTTYFGKAWLFTLCTSALAVGVCLLNSHKAMVTLLVLSIGQLISSAIVGHAAIDMGRMELLHQFCAIVHLMAAAYWLGCLLPLWLCLTYAHDSLRINTANLVSLRRFSFYGHIAVLLVFISGIGNMLLIIPHPYVWTRPYVKLLMIKIVIVLIVTGIAIYNCYHLLPQWSLKNIRHKLQYSIGAEWGLLLIALLLVSYFATLMP